MHSHELDAIDEQLASAAAKLLQAALAAARQRAEDDQTRAVLDGLKQAQLRIGVSGPRIVLELRAPTADGELRILAIEASEFSGVLQ
jgi:hypothetical protein